MAKIAHPRVIYPEKDILIPRIDPEDFEQDINGIAEKLEPSISEKLINSKLDPDEDIVEEEFLLYASGVGCATTGNIVTIIGKAKAKKSMFLSAWVSTLLGGSSFKALFSGTGGIKRGAYFDTEQSKRHCQFQYRRIMKLAGRNINPYFDYFMLRPNYPKERVEMIKEATYSSKYAFIVIDGIADLLAKGVNDEEEAITITNLLMKWSLERNINIVTVLHQNKGDSNAKGHIGSQLVQKSETVFSVEKDPHKKEISTVNSPFARGIEIEPFHFSLDEAGIPFVIDHEPDKNITKSKTPFEYELVTNYGIIKQVFKGEGELSYKALNEKIRYTLGKFSIKVGERKCRDWITYFKEENMILQEMKNKPYKLNMEW